MLRPLFRVAALISLLSTPSVRATTIRPPSLDDLVLQSESVVEATVESVVSRWEDTPQGRIIRTHVRLRIDDNLLGPTGSTCELTFLGGTVGQQSMQVAGQPHFAVGDQSVLFIEASQNRFSPVARMAYGRFRIEARTTATTDGSTPIRHILRENGEALRSADQIQAPMDLDHPLSLVETPSTGLTVDTLKDLILDRARQLGRLDRHER